ncbi:Uma2 family endonuclease [Mastigocladopsis repens]|uniref:Uma2 family endonuclease n=1 Tax=Mastigocladopsis repens TaxID=221287 RepID=UPI000378B06B|nr:Uma2 family endonuclease [Mastigocladopsis repens]
MVSQPLATTPSEVIYPESDGKPMADNTKQFRWIIVIQQNLDWLYADDPNVFVAGDLLWYPLKGRNNIVTAPDVMVAFGRPKGDRGSYKQWEEDNIPPQVVFEILSPSNSSTEMEKKLLFYDRYGVQEYYIYDPDKNTLKGWLRTEDGLDAIREIANWVSPRLSIRFDMSDEELQIYRPDGSKFFSYAEVNAQLEQEKQRAEQAQQELEAERQRSQNLEDVLKRYRDRFGDLPQ